MLKTLLAIPEKDPARIIKNRLRLLKVKHLLDSYLRLCLK